MDFHELYEANYSQRLREQRQQNREKRIGEYVNDIFNRAAIIAETDDPKTRREQLEIIERLGKDMREECDL